MRTLLALLLFCVSLQARTPDPEAAVNGHIESVRQQWSGLWHIAGDPREPTAYLRLQEDWVAKTSANEAAVGAWAVEGGLEMKAIVVKFQDGWKYEIIPSGATFGLVIEPPSGKLITGNASRIASPQQVFVGAWKITSDDGQESFYVVLNENGAAANSNYPARTDFWWVTRGAAHIRQPSGLHALLFQKRGSDDWTYALFKAESEMPVNYSAKAIPLLEPQYAGVWRLSGSDAGIKELRRGAWRFAPNNEGAITLTPNGIASLTGASIRTGTWKMQGQEAWIEWNDGSFSAITKQEEDFIIAHWRPEQDRSDAPASLTAINKVGL